MTSSLVVTGATGMVGGLALGEALGRADVASVTAIGRRPADIAHPKLAQVVHEDFTDFTSVAGSLSGQDVALYCLGVYTGAVPDDEFRRITVDYTIAFARALHAKSPGATICFLSGQGADPTEKSRMSFARYKGAAESALLAIGFPRVHIFRPGYIYPPTPRAEPNLGYRMMRGLWPVLRRVYPNVGVAADDLARVMVEVGLGAPPEHDATILDNANIRKLAHGQS